MLFVRHPRVRRSAPAPCAARYSTILNAKHRSYGAPAPRRRLGLTRREQQLVPLIAKGFTNKEIANHFCLSEQTVKNHLYHRKHKIGAVDRLNIVQRFRTESFLL
jgi:DNA-binding NarL/FixJ family response regulator